MSSKTHLQSLLSTSPRLKLNQISARPASGFISLFIYSFIFHPKRSRLRKLDGNGYRDCQTMFCNEVTYWYSTHSMRHKRMQLIQRHRKVGDLKSPTCGIKENARRPGVRRNNIFWSRWTIPCELRCFQVGRLSIPKRTRMELLVTVSFDLRGCSGTCAYPKSFGTAG
jgi:hypothetical protein